MPEFLINMLKEQYGEEVAKRIIEGYNKKRPVTFRVNTLKSSIEEIEKELKENNIEFEKVTWSNEAFIIKNAREKEIQNLPMYEEGKIYLQSLSSMLPPIILEPKENYDILDMAAAPGGKTTQIAALTQNNAHITACEMNKIRAERLKYNVEKQGANSVYIMQEDSRKINDFFSFDQILLDAPCSRKRNIKYRRGKFRKNIYSKTN
jgi:16S rRNA C967 or C1407 C5-methylase (RsmB/RsmF family)